MAKQPATEEALQQATELLESSIREIYKLRKQNSDMSPRLQMFDDMMLVLRTQPQRTSMVGAEEDIASKISNFLK